MWLSKKPDFQTKRIKGSKIRKARKKMDVSKKNLFSKISANVKYLALFGITVVLSVFVYMVDENANWFKADLLQDIPTFDGTALPINTTLNLEGWTNYKEANYNDVPSHLFRPAPSYNLDILQGEPAVWGVSSEDYYVTKRFFGVVYMANYATYHKEFSGNHSAVDVIANRGTPIHAIANGIVFKAEQGTGYGKYVVIKHYAPLNGKMKIIFSSYSHMDQINVKVGDEVKKGQIIGTVGDTGQSTTNHLHFQIETERPAGWYPGWFDQQSEALKYTINPWKYVEAHLNYTPGFDSGGSDYTYQPDSDNSDPNTNSSSSVTTEPDLGSGVVSVINLVDEEDAVQEISPSPSAVHPVASSEGSDGLIFDFKEGQSVNLVGGLVSVIVKDTYNQINRLGDNEKIKVELKGEIGEFIKKPEKKADFKNGEAEIIVKGTAPGTGHILIGKNSKEIGFIEELSLMANLIFNHDGEYSEGINETVTLQAVDQEGNPTPIMQVGGNIDLKVIEGDPEKIILTPNQITFKDFIDGKTKINIRVLDDSVGRIIIGAGSGITNFGKSDPLYPSKNKLSFPDVPVTHPNYEAIQSLSGWVISGYPDGTFKPDQTVKRVEAVTMAMKAFNQLSESPTIINLPWPDTDDHAWYSHSLKAAFDKKIVSGDPSGKFRPEADVIGPELLKMLYLANNIEPKTDLKQNPHPKVSATYWYAAYWQMAEGMNIFPELKDDSFDPATPLTRAMVAEAVYRLHQVLSTESLVYDG